MPPGRTGGRFGKKPMFKKRDPNKSLFKRKKFCRFTVGHVEFIDYKDVAYLKQFTNPHAKMLSKKRTGIPAGKQRDIMQAIKRARYMALLPYVQA